MLGPPARNGGEALTGAVVIFRDVTALKNALADLERSNDELREAQRMKEELNAFIVHDLKNPLSTVLALADLMETAEEIDPDQVRADAAETRAAAERMHRMVLDLLDLQLSEDGSLEMEREPVPVRNLLEEVAQTLRARAPGIAVGEVAPGLTLEIDRSLAFRLLTNLVDNCVKYGPPSGSILLEASVEGDGSAVLSVQDEGPGVPEELKERIFDKYAQLERDLGRRAADSRGLGLRFCRVVAEAHGGEIWVENVQPNGARFIVKLNTPSGDDHVVP